MSQGTRQLCSCTTKEENIISKMATNEKFCLRWNDFESNISTAFREIREEKDFFDCTLSCGSRQIQAHKLILSACSPFFRTILRQNTHQHPLLYLKGVEFSDLQAVLSFMYHGEVNVAQEELNSFLAVAEDLQVKGLTQNNSTESNASSLSKPKSEHSSSSSTLKRPSPPSKEEFTAPKRNRQVLQQETVNNSYDDEIQEVIPIVKEEPQVAASDNIVTMPQAYQPVMDNSSAVHQANTVAQIDENYVEEGYEYGDYGEEYEGSMMEAGAGDQNKGRFRIIIFFLHHEI